MFCSDGGELVWWRVAAEWCSVDWHELARLGMTSSHDYGRRMLLAGGWFGRHPRFFALWAKCGHAKGRRNMVAMHVEHAEEL